MDSGLRNLTLREEVYKEAYIEGYKQAVEDYAVWRDGKAHVGMGRNLQETLDKAPQTCEEPFLRWLRRMGCDEE